MAQERQARDSLARFAGAMEVIGDKEMIESEKVRAAFNEILSDEFDEVPEYLEL